MSTNTEKKSSSSDAPATALGTGSTTDVEASGVCTMPTDQLAVMIDLETLATNKDSLILSIGAVLFNPFAEPGTLESSFYYPMGLEAQSKGTLSVDTLLDFWFQQPDAAAEIVRLREEKAHRRPEFIAQKLYEWRDLASTLDAELTWWANSPSFDLDILENLFARTDCGQAPWKFWETRDFRTMKSMGKIAGVEQVEETLAGFEGFEAHNALWDAQHQAAKVQRVMRYLCKTPA